MLRLLAALTIVGGVSAVHDHVIRRSASAAAASISTKSGNVNVNVGAGKGFSVVCPPLVFGDELACDGPGVEVSNSGQCVAKVAALCTDPSVELSPDGTTCVAKADKFIQAYLDQASAKLTGDIEKLKEDAVADLKGFKKCATQSKLFIGVGTTGADADGCSPKVAEHDSVTEKLSDMSTEVRQLVDDDVKKVKTDLEKTTQDAKDIADGVKKCAGSTPQLFLGKGVKGTDDNGCGPAMATVADLPTGVKVVSELPKSFDCSKDYEAGEMVAVVTSDSTTLLLCNGKQFTAIGLEKAGSKEYKFKYSGKTEHFKIGFGATKMKVWAWGAGGGTGCAHDKNQRSRGGAGGYAYGEFPVKVGETYAVVVGEGGRKCDVAPARNSFGGGGLGQWWSNSGYWGANGGGMSGVFKNDGDFAATTWGHRGVSWSQTAMRQGPSHFKWKEWQSTSIAVAAGGGGGGGGVWNSRAAGGMGGGKDGGRGLNGNQHYTTGGTQEKGGASANAPGEPYHGRNQHQFSLVMWPYGWAMHGATDYPKKKGDWSRQYGGGGGGGYFGGGHGAYNNGGGGGSGYLKSSAKNGKLSMGAVSGCAAVAPEKDNSEYPGSVGGSKVAFGGPANSCTMANGGNGYVVIKTE